MAKTSKGVDKKKVLLAALGVGAVGTLAFFAITKLKANDSTSDPSTDSNPVLAPVKKKVTSFARKTKTLSPASSSGSNVPVVVQSYEPFVPIDIAKGIKDAGENKDLGKVIVLLQKMRNRADYLLVNSEYGHLRYWGNVSIVTDLLNNFFSSETDKQKIRTEFLRMGLVQDKATGKWSVPQNLSGFRLIKDIIAITDTYVVDRKANRIPVKKNTILGEEMSVGNGMTWFKAIDGTINSAPTRDVRRA